MTTTAAANPLLQIRFQIPFDQIHTEDVEPAIEELLQDVRAELNRLTSESGERTFANTMQRLDHLTERLDYAMQIVRHLEAVVTTPELRAAYNAVQPKVSEFYSSLPLNEALWQGVLNYSRTEEARSLTGVRKRFLEKTMDNFRRHGAELNPQGKKRIAEIDVELAKQTMRFGENVLDSTNQYEWVITDERQLAGLPQSARAMARASAAAKGLAEPSWRFTLQAPSYLAVMTYLDDEGLRRKVYQAFMHRATEEKHDNRPIMRNILALRGEKARLLGYPDFADLVLEDRMAHAGDRARQFLEDLKNKTEAAFKKENSDLLAFSGKSELQLWDIAYYAEKQRAALYDFDEEALRPYFPLESVIQGMFEVVHRLYGISVVEKTGVPVWDPQVKYYEIYDHNRSQDRGLVGAFYADWFPRENKRGGAWMDTFIIGDAQADAREVKRQDPHLGLICGNLTPPSLDTPSLLTHREVQTIFHEFGHLLHHCLSRVELRGFAGVNVAWDFVELPSQIMENWTWERDALDLFARHYQTGAPIPAELLEKMRNARNFRAANAQMRQLGFGLVDLALHRDIPPDSNIDLLAFARNILQQFAATKLPHDYATIVSFTHLFSSPVGYGAGYYSYKWAEVLDADAFTRFQKGGIFSPEVGGRFRDRILSRGDSEDPAELYRSFMGRDPDPNALLERSGLLAH
jgi:oligopeptidase A